MKKLLLLFALASSLYAQVQLGKGVSIGAGSSSTFITSLTTTGTSGPSTVSAGVLNIPNYTNFITSLTTTGTSGPATVTSGVLNIPQYSGGSGTPGGANGNLQYNNSGVFGGDANTNDDGAGNLTAKSYSATGSANGSISMTATGTPAAAPAAHSVQITVPNSVATSYTAVLPGAQPTTGNTFLSCSAANPAVCSWSAGGSGGSLTPQTVLIVVAASNSINKAVANFVATGTNDQTTINAAINSCPATLAASAGPAQCTVVLQPGVYNVGASVVIDTDDVTLTG